MRNVSISEREFKNFMWPAIAFQAVDNPGELDAHVRLLHKVKNVSTEDPGPHEDGAIPRRTLDFDEYKFQLEEDEWGRLKKAVEGWLPRVGGGVLDEFQDFRDRIRGAEMLQEQEV